MLRFSLSIFLLAALAQVNASAQEPRDVTPEKAVKLRWFGQSFFQLETSLGFRIVFDPHAIPAFGRPLVKADFVLISHPHNDHNQPEILENPPKEADIYRGVIEAKPGKQEWKAYDEKRGAITFRTVPTYHDNTHGMQRGKNAVWVVKADGLTFCHLGDLGHELTPEQAKAIGPVDVLMIPVGGIYTLNGEQAKKVVAQLKPRLYILPMHYGVPGYDDLLGPEEFLEDVKKENVKRMPNTNELIIPTDMKADAPTIVLLGWTKEPKKQ